MSWIQGKILDRTLEIVNYAACERPDGSRYGIAEGKQCRKGRQVNIDKSEWEYLTKGNYGSVEIDRNQKLIRKTNVPGRNFGPHEAELQKLMGDSGFSPKLHKASDTEIVMDLAPGKTIWKDYRPGEGEKGVAFSPKQAEEAANAMLFLHKSGFFHGDMHSLQWMVDGDKPMLIDFGLSGKAQENPRKVLQDWTKGSAFIGLGSISGDRGEKLRDFVSQYKEAGKSKPVKDRESKQETVSLEYLSWIDSL
jgi:tRNA A-37 threonylcarbamoyl transferase component Bud32